MPTDALCFLEQSDFSLRFARISRRHPLRIEDMQEVPITDTAALAGLIPAGVKLVGALRPKSALLQFVTASVASRRPGLAGVRQFIRQPAPGTMDAAWFAAAQVGDGTPPARAPWLLATCSAADHADALARLKKLQPARCHSSTLAALGALAHTATQVTLLLDIGEQTSHAFLVGPHGVLAGARVSVNLDVIAEAVQAGLNLQYRNSAAKLFFNPDCDFSDSGATIAARVAAVLQQEIVSLMAHHPAPAALFCTGLPSAQRWFVTQLAKALGLVTLEAQDVKIWATSACIDFANPDLESRLSANWFGFLYSINAQMQANPDPTGWHAEWLPVVGDAESVAPEPAIKAVTVSTTSAPPPAPAPTLVPAGKATAPAFAPQPAVASAPAAPTDGNTRRKKNLPALIGAAVLALALLGGGWFHLQSQKEETARLALEKKNAELRLQAETARARESEERARRETESRKQFEFEARQKITAAESARAQAEIEARSQAAARLANARGTLVVTTIPAGATVTIGDLPPQPTPATFAYLPIGRHSVSVALAHYDPVQVEVEINENATTHPRPIELARLVGSLALTSEPAGADYEIRPAGAFSLSLNSTRSGQTPARIDHLDAGDYTVTFTRAGWAPHTEAVTVGRNTDTRVAWTFPNGSVRFTSNPAGATVKHDGVQLGRTPFTVSVPPGAARFEIALDGFDPVVIPSRIEAGTTQELSAEFPESQRIYQVTEVDRQPETLKSVKPDLPYYLTMTAGRVEIQVVVTSEGAMRDVRILSATEADLKKFCLAALADWKFKPGLKAGKPVNTRLTIPFVITATKS